MQYFVVVNALNHDINRKGRSHRKYDPPDFGSKLGSHCSRFLNIYYSSSTSIARPITDLSLGTYYEYFNTVLMSFGVDF